MSDSEKRVPEQHARTRVTHDGPGLLTKVRLVTMHRTIRAGGFVFAERAFLQPDLGIVEKPGTSVAKRFAGVMMTTAIDFHHLPHGLVFPVDVVAAHY